MLLVLSIGVNAQKYIPFPTENAEWNVFYASSFNQIKIDTTLLQYSLQGDTTINGTLYHKLYKKIGTDANLQYVFSGGLREQDKIIYFYGYGYSKSNLSSLSNQEYLLYDFNKKTGDSVMFDHERWYKIINIDSVKIGSDFRKRYEIVIMHSNTSEFIIEGIGDVNQGLLGMITPIPTCECYLEWHFVCFSQNGESVYKNPDYVDCNSLLKTALSDVKANKPLVKVSPNPVKDFLILESINTDSPCTSVEVMDIMGRRVKTVSITNFSKYKLDLSDCAAGIYYILLKSKDKTESHKNIKL
jgi:hypothetical protein